MWNGGRRRRNIGFIDVLNFVSSGVLIQTKGKITRMHFDRLTVVLLIKRWRYCHDLGGVTIDGVWIGEWIY
jgi:hypothetical protein